jgi:signal-transduction protein with cAMP-binding, CBS, and nucleotidyltransferase domain
MKSLKQILEGRNQCWLDPDESVREAVCYLCQCNTGAMLVKEGDKAIGVFSERDLMQRVVCAGQNPDEIAVREVMSPNIVRVQINDDLELAKALMHLNRVRHLMVVDQEDTILGLISIRDIMDREVQESGEAVHQLNDDYYEKAYRPKWRMSSNRVIIEHYHKTDPNSAPSLKQGAGNAHYG